MSRLKGKDVFKLSSVPNEWKICLLDEAVKIQGGSQPSKKLFKTELSEGYVRLVQIRDYKSDKYLTYVPKNSTKKFCTANDIMIGRYGPPVFQILRGIAGAYNVALMKATPLANMDRDFLFYLLSSPPVQNLVIENSQRTAGQTGVNLKLLNSCIIPLPPLDQQKKIAAILDAADTYRQKTKALIEKYDELTQSLFLDMFGDPVTNPKGWKESTIGNEIKLITYGLTVRPTYYTEGIPLISAREIRSGKVDLSNAPKISIEDFETLSPKSKPLKGDILFSKTGSIGHSAIVENHSSFALTQNTARIVFKEIVNSIYAIYFLRTPFIQILSQRRAKGNAVKDLQLGEMKKFRFLLPPVDCQNQFAERVQAIETQKKQAQESLAKAEDLFNSLLQRAFKGELTN